jgi:hypothetical protein
MMMVVTLSYTPFTQAIETINLLTPEVTFAG